MSSPAFGADGGAMGGGGTEGAIVVEPQSNFSATTSCDRRRALYDISLTRRGAGHDETFLFEPARDADDFLLRPLHFAEANGAEHFDLFFQHPGRALRHVLEEAI